MIGAVILAAGESKRMGRPKMVLPWQGTTVIGQVAVVLCAAGIEAVVAVTGGDREQVEAALAGTCVQTAFNPRYREDQMILSLQVGLNALPLGVDAALVVLGDQPQIQAQVVRAVIAAYRESHAPLVVPSYRMRRGHPWLVQASLWPALLAMQAGQTLRDFLNRHAAQIEYFEVDTPSILKDLDTPEDYERELQGTSY